MKLCCIWESEEGNYTLSVFSWMLPMSYQHSLSITFESSHFSPPVTLTEQRKDTWRSTGRKCGWETSSGWDVMRSSLLTSCCWAPATQTASATSKPPHWMERPTSNRGRWSAASLTWWDGFSVDNFHLALSHLPGALDPIGMKTQSAAELTKPKTVFCLFTW